MPALQEVFRVAVSVKSNENENVIKMKSLVGFYLWLYMFRVSMCFFEASENIPVTCSRDGT